MQRAVRQRVPTLRNPLRTSTRAIHLTPRLRSDGPNGEPNAAASETTGTSGKMDPNQTHEAQVSQGKENNAEGGHGAQQQDVQEKATRSTGYKQEESGPKEEHKGGYGKKARSWAKG